MLTRFVSHVNISKIRVLLIVSKLNGQIIFFLAVHKIMVYVTLSGVSDAVNYGSACLETS